MDRITKIARARTWASVATPLAIVALLATGCTGSSGGTRNGAGGSPANLTFALPAAPISLDIAKDFDSNITQIMGLVTDKLERVSSTGTLSPALATKVSQPNPTTLVYQIRSGVKFSDGTPLTANDVAWSIRHAAEAPSETAGNVPAFASASATGPLQVTVRLKNPDSLARINLALVTFIQEAKFAEAHKKDLGAPAAVPVGSGPYKVAQDSTQAVKLTRNPYYWGQKPPLNQLTFTFISKDTTAQLAMRSGSIQGALVSNLKTAGNWQSINGASLYSLPTYTSVFLTLDTSTAPLNDVHVRKAIAYSVDRAGVLSAAYGKYAHQLQGLANAGTLSGVAPSTSAAQSFLGSLPQYNFDLPKAKAELAESSHPNGFSLTVPYIAGVPYSELTVLNLQQNMKSLGVTITPKSETQSQWISGIYAHKSLGIQVVQWLLPNPDPAGVLGPFTQKANIRPQGFNLANWSEPNVERANTQLSSSTDKAARWQATKTILTAVAKDVPYIPLYSPDTVVVLGGGFAFSTSIAAADLRYNGTWAFSIKAS